MAVNLANLMTADGLYPCFSDGEMARRFALARAMMEHEGVGALVVYGTAGLHNEVQYLSNFRVSREAMLVFPLDGDAALFVEYFNHVPNARRGSALRDVRWGGPDIAATVAGHLHEHGFGEKRVGIIGMIPLQRYATLQRELPQATLVDVTPQMQRLRLVKSDEEIAMLRRGQS